MQDVRRVHPPNKEVLKGMWLSFLPGAKIGVLGHNGSGKSTLLRIMAGVDKEFLGEAKAADGVRIGYLPQEPKLEAKTVREEVELGVKPMRDLLQRTEELGMLMAENADEIDRLMDEMAEVQDKIEAGNGWELDRTLERAMDALQLPPGDALCEKLSGGEKRRVALCRLLLEKPDMLLLDEPTNHLDLESIIWLERFLRDFEGAVIMTSHDREFMNRLVSKIVEIDGGDLTTYSGNYDFYEKQREIAAAQQEAQYARQQAMLAKEQAFIERFKARASHAAQVQSRVKKLEKIEKVEPPKRRRVVEFDFRQPQRSGEDVAKLASVTKAYGSRVIYDGLELLIRRRERWCVMGVNGAGKSTLLKLVAGETKPDSGAVTIGSSVKMGYFAQHAMEVLDPDRSVLETLKTEFPFSTEGSLRTIAGAFGFSGDDVDKPCRVLSGGEKARVVLAKMLFDPPNFLVLDEPTNHLDLATKEVLVKALGDFEGTMLFVSHDRSFLAQLSNRVLELGADGMRTYGGGYTEYVAESGHEAPGVS
jgi:ATPase subunit of ABC transporter with duplicated ATPase domains